MARIGIVITVIIALGWSAFVGYDLLTNSKDRYAPGFIFDKEDGGVLRINHLEEIQQTDVAQTFKRNAFFRELPVIQSILHGRQTYYLSRDRYVLIIESNQSWKTSTIEKLKQSITLADININHNGKFIVLTSNQTIQLQSERNPVFQSADKKASANYWIFQDQQWKRSDIYALPRGYYEYRTASSSVNHSSAINDSEVFASVLPQTVTQYEFFERFYAASVDSVFAKSPLAEWVDQGFVLATYGGKQLLISDYRTAESPGITLINQFKGESGKQQNILMYQCIPLAANFPQPEDSIIYLLELEDKVILTTDIETARQLNLAYQLGETLALNQHKFNQLFSELPQAVHYRFVNDQRKTSRTFRSNLDYVVQTLPPGEQFQSNTVLNNWTNGVISQVQGAVPIKDHIRGANSVFIFNNNNEYALIDGGGKTLWQGTTETPIIGAPQVVDIYENDKKQLLFRTKSKVHLLDLNGKQVGNFPYSSEFDITTDIHTFKWKNTFRYLFGTQKGELIVLNTTGSELNIVQAGNQALKGKVFAINRGGNLRGWCINENQQVYLTYLETPAKAEILPSQNAINFQKIMGDVVAFNETDGHVTAYAYANLQERTLGKGQLMGVGNTIVLRDQTHVSVFNRDFNFRYAITLPFNEIGKIEAFSIKGQDYLLVQDYLKNKIHLIDNKGVSIPGFPKDGMEFITYAFHAETGELTIYSGISGNLICYRITP
jgi:hypothetical protein